MSIANIDYIKFYKDAFLNTSEKENFFNQIEQLSSDNNRARNILHQSARMVWLADHIEELVKDRPAFQILFYLIAAELSAKIVKRYDKDRKSKEHVRIFFEELCSDQHRVILSKAFDSHHKKISVREAVDLLYEIRCDFVHEGKYWSLALPDQSDDYPEITGRGEDIFTAYIAITELRKIILEGSVLAAKQCIER